MNTARADSEEADSLQGHKLRIAVLNKIMSTSASHFSGWLQKQGGVSSGKAGVSAVFLVSEEPACSATQLPTASPLPDLSLSELA